MNEPITLLSSNIKWKGNIGTTTASDHFVLRDRKSPDRIQVKSERTGAIRTYEIDRNDGGFEYGWDGEYTVFTDNLWDGTKLIIWNY
jgi:hypothetical protein